MRNKEDVLVFVEFAKKQKKVKLGGKLMYDVSGSHKYLSPKELLDYYLELEASKILDKQVINTEKDQEEFMNFLIA